MVLTKDELIASLDNEVRLLLHLASKVDPGNQDFRPTPKQRSTLELLQYLTMMGPIHARGVLASTFDRAAWGKDWVQGEAAAKTLTLEQVKESIGQQPALFRELFSKLTDADLRAEIEMFGGKTSRGAMLVRLLLNHYAAYRMQLFLYLKASGREELNTMNLWAGVDHWPRGVAEGSV
jgi:hypothetical protein